MFYFIIRLATICLSLYLDTTAATADTTNKT